MIGSWRTRLKIRVAGTSSQIDGRALRSLCWQCDEIAKFAQVDVAPGDYGDNGALTGFPGQRGGERQGTGAFGNDTRLLRHQAHRGLGLFQADDDRTVDEGSQAIPHARKEALTAGAIDERGLPVFKHLTCSNGT